MNYNFEKLYEEVSATLPEINYNDIVLGKDSVDREYKLDQLVYYISRGARIEWLRKGEIE